LGAQIETFRVRGVNLTFFITNNKYSVEHINPFFNEENKTIFENILKIC
jgi:hypothetical protein